MKKKINKIKFLDENFVKFTFLEQDETTNKETPTHKNIHK